MSVNYIQTTHIVDIPIGSSAYGENAVNMLRFIVLEKLYDALQHRVNDKRICIDFKRQDNEAYRM